MIDPTNITNYNLAQHELEEQLIWWVFAAGHNGITTAKGVDKFLQLLYRESDKFKSPQTPFCALYTVSQYSSWQYVLEALSRSSLGCWRIKSKTLHQFAYPTPVLGRWHIDLKTISVEELEKFHGIGPKTARCFVLHTRKGARVAGLDTHLLKFLRDEGYDVPKSTPSSKKKYRELEEVFLRICDERGKIPAEYDLEIWNAYRMKNTLDKVTA